MINFRLARTTKTDVLLQRECQARRTHPSKW